MARIDKINEEVKRELANIIRELKDTRIPLMTSVDRKSTRLNSSHWNKSRMPSSA